MNRHGRGLLPLNLPYSQAYQGENHTARCIRNEELESAYQQITMDEWNMVANTPNSAYATANIHL
jgi:hypothetical protein